MKKGGLPIGKDGKSIPEKLFGDDPSIEPGSSPNQYSEKFNSWADDFVNRFAKIAVGDDD